MEGTHTDLQLHRPIMELCYISFCLPKGRVRGFTYKGCICLDKSNKRFHNCYQVREGSEALERGGQPYKNIGDIFFKQTPTKDILTELYRLNAEKERLLASLLNSSHILGVKMGNQDGKLQEVSETLKSKNADHLGFKDQPESFLKSMEKKSILKKKQLKKCSKHRENMEDSTNKKMKRKIPAVLTPSIVNSKDILFENENLISAKHSVDGSSISFACSYQTTVEDADELLTDLNQPSGRSRRERYLFENSQAMGSDTDLSISFSDCDNDVSGHGFAHSSHNLLDDVEDTLKVMQLQQSSSLLDSFQDSSPPKFGAVDKTVTYERLHGCNCGADICNSTVEARGLPDIHVSQLAKTRVECSQMPNISPVFTTVMQENEYIQQYKGQQEHVLINDSGNQGGAVNKTLLKVLQTDRFDESAEWKRLQRVTRAGRNQKGLVYETRATVPQSNKDFSLHLPKHLKPDICQTRTNIRQEDKMPLVAARNVLQKSYTSSHTRKQEPPLPSPLSSKLPSPELHHRILPMPLLNTIKESGFSDSCRSKSYTTNLVLNKDLEAPLHLRLSESGPSTHLVRQPGPHPCAGADHFGKSIVQEQNSIHPHHLLHSG